jgi:hypothetical protein
VSRCSRIVLLTAAGVLAASAVAKDNRKHVPAAEASQTRNRSTDWDRRTDTEWRRYTDKAANRRTSVEPRRRTERMRGLDMNGDGVVSRSESRGNEQAFSGVRRTTRAGDRYTQRNDRFRVLDRNGDGIISQDEWNRR